RHRSQDMGAGQPAGPRATALVLVDAVGEGATAAGFFAGVDTSLAALAAELPSADRSGALAEIERYRAAVREARDGLGVSDPGRAGPPLGRARGPLEAVGAGAGGPPGEGAARGGRPGADLAHAVAHHAGVAERALLAAAGIVVEARTDDAVLVPGEET